MRRGHAAVGVNDWPFSAPYTEANGGRLRRCGPAACGTWSENALLCAYCPRRFPLPSCVLADWGVQALLRRRKTTGKEALPGHAPSFRAFLWREPYGHFLRAKYSTEGARYVFRCHPGRASFLRAERANDRQ